MDNIAKIETVEEKKAKLWEVITRKERMLLDIVTWLKQKGLWDECLKDIKWEITDEKEVKNGNRS